MPLIYVDVILCKFNLVWYKNKEKASGNKLADSIELIVWVQLVVSRQSSNCADAIADFDGLSASEIIFDKRCVGKFTFAYE